jgi:hypothetical protein
MVTVCAFCLQRVLGFCIILVPITGYFREGIINQLIFVIEKHCVFFQVGIEFLKIVQLSYELQKFENNVIERNVARAYPVPWHFQATADVKFYHFEYFLC